MAYNHDIDMPPNEIDPNFHFDSDIGSIYHKFELILSTIEIY